jgi:colanic acid/amylovoran biosynthesis protein
MKRAIYPPKNIIISHVYSSDNKGDAALTSVLISDLKRVFPTANITILQLTSTHEDTWFEGIPEKPGFMNYALNRYKNPLSKIAYAGYMMSITLVAAGWLRITGYHLYLPQYLRMVADIYEQADLIVPVGGGYIRSRKGLRNRWNIPLLLHPLLFGYLLDKPTVLYAQSMGPFQTKLENILVAYVLKRMTLILLREDTSLALLADLGVTNNVSRAIDSGFLQQSGDALNVRKLYHIPADKLLVGVTVRSWLAGEAQQNYEKAVAGALDELVVTSNAHVVFVPQVTATKGDDDRLISHRVQGLMHNTKATTLIDDEPDHYRIKAIYDKLDILLGTRFHSVIFSLTSFVPVLAIEYEHKTSGIMHDLQLEDWVVKIEDATTENLTKLLQKLVHEQTSYRTHLRKHLPPYLRKAQQTIMLLKHALLSPRV